MIIPTIFTSDPKELCDKLNLVKGKIGLVQVDIVDGIFASNKTIGLKDLENRPEGVGVELHLMVDCPEDWIEQAVKIKPTSIVAQIEMMVDPEKYFCLAAELGVPAGIAIDLPTEIEVVAPEIYIWTEKLVLMSVKAGEGGQNFNTSVLQKIEATGRGPGGTVSKTIAVDGGLNEETIALCAEAGASEFYVGSAFWGADDLLKRYGELEYSAMVAQQP